MLSDLKQVLQCMQEGNSGGGQLHLCNFRELPAWKIPTHSSVGLPTVFLPQLPCRYHMKLHSKSFSTVFLVIVVIAEIRA